MHPELEYFCKSTPWTLCPRSGCTGRGLKNRRWHGWTLCDQCWPRTDAQAAALYAELSAEKEAIIAAARGTQ